MYIMSIIWFPSPGDAVTTGHYYRVAKIPPWLRKTITHGQLNPDAPAHLLCPIFLWIRDNQPEMLSTYVHVPSEPKRVACTCTWQHRYMNVYTNWATPSKR